MGTSFIDRLKNFFVNYFTLTQDLVAQSEAESAIREDVSFRGTKILVLIVAIFIASLGLNTNSTAVIIGAMLISPLMDPIIGLGLGVGVYDFELIKRSLRNLIIAAGFSVLASTLYFLISPMNENHSELLARTSPSIYDVLIGFFGGAAGIIGLCSKTKGNVIPGVAIATALMPPLCTAGYGLATLQFSYFFGAFYLFVINSIYIAFATFIGVKLFKYHGENVVDNVKARKMRRIVYCLAVLTMLPSIWLTYTMLRHNKFVMSAGEFVAKECRFADTQVLNRNAFERDGERYLEITLIGRVLPTDSLNSALSSRLDFYGLSGTKLIIVQGATVSDGTMSPSSASDIYQLTQSTITRQQTEIDSLRNLIREAAGARIAGLEIIPELRVIFPQVDDIAITQPVFAAMDSLSAHLDTVNVAMVKFSSPMNPAQLEKFREYLSARLSLPLVHIVEISPSITSKEK